MHLEDEKKQRFKAIQEQLAKLTTKYEENLMDATDKFSHHVTDISQLKGIPEHNLAAFKALAQSKNLDGWLINLEFPSYYAVITYAENRDLRKLMYTAYVTRASDQGPFAKTFDNTDIMNQILQLRHEEARLVGFENYAYYSLATKMADTPEQILSFLWDLVGKSQDQAKGDYAALKDFADYHYQIKDLQAWDMAFMSEKLREHQYHLSQEALRPYFSVDAVLEGLFNIVSKLYDITIVEKVYDVDVWHDSVRYFEIFDVNQQQIAGCYVDLYAREKKRGGAWMDDCSDRHVNQQGELQLPIAFLNCNFNQPIENKPALLTHDEVITLFHEFGHGLHHMLTKIDVAAVSGINGVAWDAVEFPSQFMEHFCWQLEALNLFAHHYETKAPIPEALFERLQASKNFQSAMQMLRQLEFAIFDLRLHHEYQSDKPLDIQQVLNEVREKVSVVPVPAFNRFQHGFSHIFAGGYAAGYYSYKWAEVLACDAFATFKQQGIFDKATGRRFLECILQKGGAFEPMDLFIQFQGREPSIDALLEDSGI